MINIDGIAALVSSQMVAIVDANRKSFIESDDFEHVYENCFDMLVAPKIPKWSYTDVYDAAYKHPEVQLAFTVIKEMIAEERSIAHDNMIYHQNPMAYYGLKQKDFI